MRLLSAAVRNYRIHSEVSVTFDPGRTLISGPNESGKSTLIEAIHRGLFLRATVTGEARKSMLPTGRSGQPEVELSFEAGGAVYHLSKRFAGQAGSTLLAEVGGRTWHGEEAEVRLQELLGAPGVGRGPGILNRVSEQWAHIWVWQGMSGVDPAESAQSVQARILARLQESGGAIVRQSEVDARVVARLASAAAEFFTPTGRVRAASELDRAEQQLESAETQYREAQARVAALEDAAKALVEADAAIVHTDGELAGLRGRFEELGKRGKAIGELRVREKEQEGVLEVACGRLEELEQAQRRVSDCRGTLGRLSSERAPLQAELRAMEEKLRACREVLTDAERVRDDASTAVAEARLHRDLAEAWVQRLEKEARLAELAQRLKRASDLQARLGRLRDHLARLPTVDQEQMQKLEDIVNRRSRAEAALEAMAAEIELVAADCAVAVNGAPLQQGRPFLVTDAADLKIGDSVFIRVRPGGGSALSEARNRVSTLAVELQEELGALGMSTFQQAVSVAKERSVLLEEIGRLQAAAEENRPSALADEVARLKDDLTGVVAQLERLLLLCRTAEEMPASVAAARDLLRQGEETLREAEEAENKARAARDELREQVDSLAEAVRNLRARVDERSREVDRVEAELTWLLGTYGEDQARAAALTAMQTAVSAAQCVLASIRARLVELQPDRLEADSEQLSRTREQAEAQRSEALSRRDVSRAMLRSEGTEDPYGSAALAKAELEVAREQHRAVRRQAEALRLLSGLFGDEQQMLADQFSGPLAERIDAYLQCLFGPQAHVVVRLGNNKFAGFDLSRAGESAAMPFAALSGGTREQVAAAVRLAVAELLAAEHDGGLPVVFDDAFVNSDPERVVTLQRMLDLAAARGMQVIVLTCNPADYVALGAREVRLTPSG